MTSGVTHRNHVWPASAVGSASLRWADTVEGARSTTLFVVALRVSSVALLNALPEPQGAGIVAGQLFPGRERLVKNAAARRRRQPCAPVFEFASLRRITLFSIIVGFATKTRRTSRSPRPVPCATAYPSSGVPAGSPSCVPTPVGGRSIICTGKR